MISPLYAILLVPVLAALLLALVTNYRWGAAINVLACGLTFAAGVSLLFVDRVRTDVRSR